MISSENAEGIYCTVWSARHHPQNLHAKYELLNGVDDLPFQVCRLHHDSKRLYDTHSMVDLLRGVQWQVKAERDSRIDRSSIAPRPPSRVLWDALNRNSALVGTLPNAGPVNIASWTLPRETPAA